MAIGFLEIDASETIQLSVTEFELRLANAAGFPAGGGGGTAPPSRPELETFNVRVDAADLDSDYLADLNAALLAGTTLDTVGLDVDLLAGSSRAPLPSMLRIIEGRDAVLTRATQIPTRNSNQRIQMELTFALLHIELRDPAEGSLCGYDFVRAKVTCDGTDPGPLWVQGDTRFPPPPGTTLIESYTYDVSRALTGGGAGGGGAASSPDPSPIVVRSRTDGSPIYPPITFNLQSLLSGSPRNSGTYPTITVVAEDRGVPITTAELSLRNPQVTEWTLRGDANGVYQESHFVFTHIRGVHYSGPPNPKAREFTWDYTRQAPGF